MSDFLLFRDFDKGTIRFLNLQKGGGKVQGIPLLLHVTGAGSSDMFGVSASAATGLNTT